ncbi:MAG: S8 family serine peptidase [Kofleriaceae bacterium]|nr:S8 family serine peptidase [Kofleriaceae bacterium]
MLRTSRPPRLASVGRTAAIVAGATAAVVGVGVALRTPSRCPGAATAADRAPAAGAAAIHVEVAGPDAPARVQALLAPRLRGAASIQVAAVAPLFARPSTPALAGWVRIELTASPDDAAALAAWLVARPGVVDAFVAPVITLADDVADDAPGADADRCPLRTPRYDALQGYLAAAPGGIDAAAAWPRPGGRGEGVWFADIEGGWNRDHEDLPGDRIHHVAGRAVADPAWQAHGTAVLGEVVGRDNGIGVVGIAPDVERVVTASIFDTPVAVAIDAAQAALRPGDVLLIELQGQGPRRRYVPVEYWRDVFEVIQHATARGVIVVEAAGNGGEDLDHRAYRGAFDRARRDSGAILVGAGAPARAGWTDRSRLDFSNYGSRVDVQGWGRRVTSLDYGDLQECDRQVRTRNYTDQFSGTSSASPIVAGAAILLQGVHRAATGAPLTPAAMRALLVATGTPQVDGPHGRATQHIGPRPDLARALEALPATAR